MVLVGCLQICMKHLHLKILNRYKILNIQIFKQFTSYIPRTTENRFKYTGTEQNQCFEQKPILQKSLIEGLPTPIFEYVGRMKHIEPRPDYVVNVDMSSNAKQQFKKEFG